MWIPHTQATKNIMGFVEHNSQERILQTFYGAKVIFFITTWGHDPWAEIAAPKQFLIISKDPRIPYLPIDENF